MHTLQDLASRYHVSIDNLRRVAFQHCGIPADTAPEIVDFWLYERLASAANWTGLHFALDSDASVERMIEHSLVFEKGTFLEKCAASLAELKANPIIRHEILLPEHVGFFETPARAPWDHFGAEKDYFGDVIGFFPNFDSDAGEPIGCHGLGSLPELPAQLTTLTLAWPMQPQEE